MTGTEGSIEKLADVYSRSSPFRQSRAKAQNQALEKGAEAIRQMRNYLSKFMGFAPIGVLSANAFIDQWAKYVKRGIELHQSGLGWWWIAPDLGGLMLNQFTGMENLYKYNEKRDLLTGRSISDAEAEFAGKLFAFEMLMNIMPGAGAIVGIAVGTGVRVAASIVLEQLASRLFSQTLSGAVRGLGRTRTSLGAAINTAEGLAASKNCGYCTIAALSEAEMTSSQAAVLANQVEGAITGRSLAEPTTTFSKYARQAGVKLAPAESFASSSEAIQFMKSQPKGAEFAVVYKTGPNEAHVIVARNGRLGVTYMDYQTKQIVPRFGLPKFADWHGDVFVLAKEP